MKNSIMRKKSKNKCVSTIVTSLLAMLFTVPLFAAEYNYTYAFEQPEVKKQDNTRYLLEMEDTWLKDDIVGDPMLPVKTAKIFISAHEKVASIKIVYGSLHTIAGTYLIQHALTPYPISYKGSVIIDKANPNVYAKDELYPPVSFREKSPQFVRGVQVVPVDLMPVLYNPLKGTLQYYEKMEVKITTVQQKRPDWVMPFRNSRKDRKNILKTIDNDTDFIKVHPLAAEQAQPPVNSESTIEPLQESTSSVSSPLGTREYVVITTSNLIEAFTTLTDHRASSSGGAYTTHIEDIANINTSYEGRDLAEKMRNFVIDMYSNYGTQYVLLGGDCDGPSDQQPIPTRGCYAVVGSTTDHDIPADLYFGCLDGSWNGDGDADWGEANDGESGGDIDWASEVYVGRIAADTSTEALNHIAKIIAFESASDRLNKTLLVGEKLDDEPTWGGDRMDWVYTYMNSTPKTELYDRTAIWSKNDLLNIISTDTHHWINHLGHANVTYDMKMYGSDVASMSNSNYLLIYTQGCYPGSMDSRGTGTSYYSSDCFGEAVTNGYSDRGAFAFIGNSRYGWYNPGTYVYGASNLVHKEFVEAIFTDGYTKLGEANQISKTDLDLNSGLYRWIAFASNLLGCPATDMSQLNNPNEAPTAAFSFSTSDLTVTLTDNSTDNDGSIASWFWNFGDGSSSTTQNPTHTYASAGTYTVTLTVTDDDGASDNDSTPVTVTAPPPPDTEAPSITAPEDVSVEATGVTTTVDLGLPVVSDTVDPSPEVTNDAPATFPVDTTTVTWTATDASGNSATATQTVTVSDTTAPTITAPADVNVESSVPTAVELGTPTVSDLVDPSPTISNDAPELFPVDTTVVTWTTTDSSNNTATATQTVTVTAPPPPSEIYVGDLDATALGKNVWTATITITVHNSSGAAGEGVTVSGTWSDGSDGSCVTSSDGQCSVVSQRVKSDSLTFEVVSLSRDTNTYDSSQNSDPDNDSDGTSIIINKDGSTTIPGEDTTPPTITLLGDNPVTITVGSTYVDAGATASDNVDGNLTSAIVTVSTVDTAVVGTYAVTYNVSDSAENTAEEVRTVTVTDANALVAPTKLSAKFSKRTNTVALSWSDSNSDEDGFIIEKSSNGSDYGTIETSNNSDTQFADTLSSETGTYYYRVKAYKGTERSDPSNVDSIIKR